MLFAAILGLCLCAALSNAATKPTTETPAGTLEKRILGIDQQPIESRFFWRKKAAGQRRKYIQSMQYNEPFMSKLKKRIKKKRKENEDRAKEDATEKEDTAEKDTAKKDAVKGDAGKAGDAAKTKTLLPDEAYDSGTENLDLNLNKRSLESLTSRISDYGDGEAIETESLDDIDDLI